jgi:hypothetical protein
LLFEKVVLVSICVMLFTVVPVAWPVVGGLVAGSVAGAGLCTSLVFDSEVVTPAWGVAGARGWWIGEQGMGIWASVNKTAAGSRTRAGL